MTSTFAKKTQVSHRRGPHVTAPKGRRATTTGPTPFHPIVQAKLRIGAPNDKYEQEADRVADQVMRMRSPEPAMKSTTESLYAPDTVRRKCAACSGGGELCPECEGELQRQPAEEEEELRAKAAPGQTPSSSPLLEANIHSLRGGGQPLPASQRGFFEPRFATDFSAVRVHTGPGAGEMARSLNARAFTVGSEIVFGQAEYNPVSSAGLQLLAHELTHVVQQSGESRSALPQLQCAVRFRADLNNVSVRPENGATITGDDYDHEYAHFEADAEVTAIGDTEAELNEWDVGVLQDMVANWEREYWRRSNADGLGRFVEQRWRPINTTFRDQEDGASTVWSADDEHQLLSGVPKTPSGSAFEATTTIHTADDPGGGDVVNGSDVTTMDASDGTRNIDIERAGTRFDTFISAHNTVTDEWRHLRRVNWNYMKSVDFTGSGASLAVGTAQAQVGHHGPYAAGRRAPLLSGVTANDAALDDANWDRRRVNGWS